MCVCVCVNVNVYFLQVCREENMCIRLCVHPEQKLHTDKKMCVEGRCLDVCVFGGKVWVCVCVEERI